MKRLNRQGIVLVLVSGFLILMGVLSLTLLQLARLSAAGAQTVMSRTQAALAAASGMEYAAARLSLDPMPRYAASVENRGDDWTFRDGLRGRLEGSFNPSYSHGEPWLEPLGGGEYATGDGFLDADGNGRFSARTGRLRGGGGLGGARFSLKIETCSTEGGFPLNAGYLDDNGRGDFLIPDHQEFGIQADPYHRALEHVLNNLGTVLLPVNGTRRELVPAGDSGSPDNWFDLSRLGYDLLSRRPAGGYRTTAGIRSALSAAGYTPAECEQVEPYLCLGPYGTLVEGRRFQPTDGADFPQYVPINLTVAPRPVLTALWMYVTAVPPVLTGQSSTWVDTLSSRTASRAFSDLSLLLFKDEAERLADRVLSLRGSGPLGWKRLYQDFASHAREIFRQDAADLPDIPGVDIAGWSWVQAKTDLAFQAVSLDPYPYPDSTDPLLDGSCGGLAAWGSWGADRGDFDPANGVLPSCAISVQGIRRIRYPAGYPRFLSDPQEFFPSNPADPWGGGNPGRPYVKIPPGPLINPQGGVIAAPGQFRIQSLGWEGTPDRSNAFLDARLCVSERLCFANQEDFESFAGGGHLAKRGIAVVDPSPAARRSTVTDGVVLPPSVPLTIPRSYPSVVSLPRWNQRAFENGPGFSRSCGALALASRQGGLQDAQLYWPLREDFDGHLNNQGTYTGGPNGDFWHEIGPGYPFTLGNPLPVWPDPRTSLDRHELTPFQVSSSTCPLQCPMAVDATDPASKRLETLSVEAWVIPQARANIVIMENLGINAISIRAQRGGELYPDQPGTEFTVRVLWNTPDGVAHATPPGIWFFPDDPSVSPVSWTYHVVLTAQRDTGAGRTWFRLFVNGEDHPLAGPMTLEFPGEMWVTDPQRLLVTGVDEIRLYARALDPGIGPAWPAPAEAKVRHQLGRFVRKGTFRSPLYVLDVPARILSCRWAGMVPDGFPPGCLQVNLYGYSDVAGTTPAWSQNPRTVLFSEAETSLAELPSVRSFRWEAVFDCSAVPPTRMMDSPVLESVQLSLASESRTPAWSSWTAR